MTLGPRREAGLAWQNHVRQSDAETLRDAADVLRRHYTRSLIARFTRAFLIGVAEQLEEAAR